MIVCICHNVSEQKIRHAVAAGTTSMSELRRDLSVATCCGKCHTCAKKVLNDCLNSGVARAVHFMQQNAMAV